jgi:FkbM family methyltransferase
MTRTWTHALTPRAVAAVLAAVVSAGCQIGPAQPRHVFVDAGAHMGESYQAFRKSGLYSRHNWEIFAIEANPGLAAKLPHAPLLTVLSKAAWVEDGTLEFHMESETSGANSIAAFKPAEELTTIQVESFDFSQWVRSSFTEEDYVILSMDIEGAEFDILQKMLDDDTAKLIDRLYVEFHPQRLRELKDMGMGAGQRWSRQIRNDFYRLGLIVIEDSVDDTMRAGNWLDFIV